MMLQEIASNVYIRILSFMKKHVIMMNEFMEDML